MLTRGRFTAAPGVLEALGVAELDGGDLIQGVADLNRKIQVVCRQDSLKLSRSAGTHNG